MYSTYVIFQNISCNSNNFYRDRSLFLQTDLQTERWTKRRTDGHVGPKVNPPTFCLWWKIIQFKNDFTRGILSIILNSFTSVFGWIFPSITMFNSSSRTGLVFAIPGKSCSRTCNRFSPICKASMWFCVEKKNPKNKHQIFPYY